MAVTVAANTLQQPRQGAFRRSSTQHDENLVLDVLEEPPQAEAGNTAHGAQHHGGDHLKGEVLVERLFRR
jgi:hypothetical protein